jgi:type 1 fimbria pilin
VPEKTMAMLKQAVPAAKTMILTKSVMANFSLNVVATPCRVTAGSRKMYEGAKTAPMRMLM